MEHLLAAAATEEDALLMHMMGAAPASASASSPWESTSSSSLRLRSSFSRRDDDRRAPQDPIVDNDNDNHNRHDDHHHPPPDDSLIVGGFSPPPLFGTNINVVGTTTTSTTTTTTTHLTWQAMFRQLKDFRSLGHTKYPPRMARWMAAQRRRYKLYGIGIEKPTGIITGRIRQLNSIGFEWNIHDIAENASSLFDERQWYAKSPVHPRVILPPPGTNGNGIARNSVNNSNSNSNRPKKKHRSRDNDRGINVDVDNVDNGSSTPKARSAEKRQAYVQSMVRAALEKDKYPSSKRPRRASASSRRASTSTPVSKTKKKKVKAKHAKPGQQAGGGLLPRHALFSTSKSNKGKQEQRQMAEAAVGVSHPSLLFDLGKEEKPSPQQTGLTSKLAVSESSIAVETMAVQSKDSDEGMQTTQPSREDNAGDNDNKATTSTTADAADASVEQSEPTKPPPQPTQLRNHDIVLSLKHTEYKKLLFDQFRRLGRKKDNGKTDDCDVLRNTARDVFEALKSAVTNGNNDSGTDGRFLKKVKGSSSSSSNNGDESWYEVVDDSWALQKISNDLRQRMDCAHLWLDESETNGQDVVKDQEVTKNVDSDVEDPMPNEKDLVVSLKTPKYREVMFARFKLLGAKMDEDDYDALKAIGREVFQGFKTELGAGGRFFRKARGVGDGEAPYELLDDATVLMRITQDLKRRMDSANNWLNDSNSEAKQENDKSVGIINPDTKQTEEEAVAESKLEAIPSEIPSAVASKVKTEEALESPEADTSSQSPDWELGTYFNRPGVQYFKSDIGDFWVEQVVPRKTVKVGGPDSDKYFLSPDGRRFRSTLEVQRFLEETNQTHGTDESVEAEEENVDDDASSTLYESEEEEEDGNKSDNDGEDGSKFTNNPCMCKKSKCLKLYCDCFNKEKYCSGCYCIDCHNLPRFDDERDRAIAGVKKRDPDAFKPRVKSTVECKCKRTACLKKYCDCYLHGAYCGDSCQCRGCENRDPEKLQHLQQRREYQEDEESEEVSNSDDSADEENEDEEHDKEEEEHPHDPTDESEMQTSRNYPKKRSYAESLHEMVSYVDATDPSVISWVPSGEAFYVHDRSKEKLGLYLEEYFRHKNYTSLVRQLNTYGFTRHLAGSLTGAFYHPGFRKDMKSGGDFSSISRCSTSTGKKRPVETRKEEERPSKVRKVAPAKMVGGSERETTVTKQKPVTKTCPRCFLVFTFPYARTAAASFSRHVEACKTDQDQEDDVIKVEKAEESNKSPGKMASIKPRKSLSSQKKDTTVDSSAKKRKSWAAGDQQSAITFHCSKCSKDFTFSSKKTATASFNNHVRKCDPMNAIKKITPKVHSLEKKTGKRRGKSRGSSLSPDEVPSYSIDSLRDDDALKYETTTATLMKGESTPKSTVTSKKLPKAPTTVEPAPNSTATAKKSPKISTTAESSHKSIITAKKLPTAPIIAEPTPTIKLESVSSGKPHDNDLVLSLKNPRYKQIMVAKFQTLGKRSGGEENERLHEMKHHLFTLFKRDMGKDGRFLKSDRHMNETWAVNDEEALTKIMMDLKRRNESSKHWFEESTMEV